MDIEDDTIMDEIETDELYQQQDFEFTRLSDMVRKHYLQYLEKQLNENFTNWQKGQMDGLENWESIKQTAAVLEEKAIKACMMAKIYQRHMVKIIANVRQYTQENRLVNQLEMFLRDRKVQENNKYHHKTTQTQDNNENNEERTVKLNEQQYKKSFAKVYEGDCKIDKHTISLEQKIQMFQEHLYRENTIKAASVLKKSIPRAVCRRPRKRLKKCRLMTPKEEPLQKDEAGSHLPEIVTNPSFPSQPIESSQNSNIVHGSEVCDIHDTVALELAQLFNEEKTELDEIFGIDPNEEPDDPQIRRILKEIENAKINDKTGDTPTQHNSDCNQIKKDPAPTLTTANSAKLTPLPPQNDTVTHKSSKNSANCTDLTKSEWPCELYMQRRKLSESLSRLVDEDFRWVDIMKWKFAELFGEDSDDEFAACSPSIELDEVLINSCVRRISPWMVKHLMKPMKDGLIGNRFLFKKLGKQLARKIIMENQYPDEPFIRRCVENFFCLHQAVMSLDDIVDIDNISLEC
ncbi:uncharacterized protein LOC119639303 isoform X1 [Glossina fuscipes]|uniref:Uncharacterized protein LOC119639303 isoform X1 n=1 Tax=Glossina fuscipes TaxID=7396 RepID=A0A9C6DLS7_9MUSC|nr:uncharacterized protein LOC119639303 isoform X1 [Glossina fuscipes]XP_037892532.1 uncharacterized protein LOC119639303 isoform X1 [Glossina fuscipes]KAI9579962.1 hypothetical protein GQX74_000750 [Glossina fuscipes]